MIYRFFIRQRKEINYRGLRGSINHYLYPMKI
nr:MAG TPA: hypothetical protein [Caudoviricetes sp.]